jgi:hypothetical protein
MAGQIQRDCHDTVDFIQVPRYHSAIRAFALTHSRRNVAQRQSWFISFSLDVDEVQCYEHVNAKGGR